MVFFLHATVALGIGVFSFINGLRLMRKKRLIENIPTSKIRSLAMGLAEVYGKASKYRRTLKSPISWKECLYYDYNVQEYRSSGKSGRWVTIRKGKESVSFNLKDSTGTVLINPAKAKIDIPKNDIRIGGILSSSAPKYIESFCERSGIGLSSFLGFSKQLRFIEQLILPDDNLYVLGTAQDNPFVDEATSIKNEKDIMIAKGKDEKVFLISNKHESELLRSMQLKMLLFLLGGGFLILVGLSALFISFALVRI